MRQCGHKHTESFSYFVLAFVSTIVGFVLGLCANRIQAEHSHTVQFGDGESWYVGAEGPGSIEIIDTSPVRTAIVKGENIFRQKDR